MATMIERVAAALAENRKARKRAAEYGDACACMGPPEYCLCEQGRDLVDARAAIAAMREPTEGMIEAAEREDGGDPYAEFDSRATGTDHWHAMIDAALEEKL